MFSYHIFLFLLDCLLEDNVAYNGGNVVDRSLVKSVEECANRAAHTYEGLVWTYRYDKSLDKKYCYVKNSNGGREETGSHAHDHISGNRACATKKPSNKHVFSKSRYSAYGPNMGSLYGW